MPAHTSAKKLKSSKFTFSKAWWNVALLHLLVIALGGLLLRAIPMFDLEGLNFAYIRHAHSHGALLGWLYSAFFVGLLQVFLPSEMRQIKAYTWLFWLSQVAVLGMLLSFPVQGYAAVSISFSTMHILVSYGFAFVLFRDLRSLYKGSKEAPISVRFARVSLMVLVLSSFGPWSLGPIMAKGLSGSEWYYNAIYYYLHFQYNGWFTFALFALFFRWLEVEGISFPKQTAQQFFWLMTMAVGPAYLLSVLWIEPAAWVYWVAGFSAVLQLGGYVLFCRICAGKLAVLKAKLHTWVKLLFALAFLAFTLKLVMQVFSALPYVADLAYKVRHFVIGYLHLVLIGFVSLFLLGFFVQLGWLSLQRFVAKFGLALFLIGFFLSEALIFGQGTGFWWGMGPIPAFDVWLFAVSCGMPAGVLLLVISQLTKSRTN